MRLKAIPAWEKYIEKILLGVLLVAFLAVLILQFASNPNVVDVRVNGRNESLTPGQLNPMLIEWSDLVQKRQRDDAPPMDTPPSKDDVRMVAGDVKDITLGRVVAGLMHPRTSPILASSIMQNEIRSDLLFNNPEPLMAIVMMDRVENFSDELKETAIEEYPELASYTSAEGNREIDWLIPVGEISMRAIRAEFEDSDAEHNAIPSYWRDNTYAIVDVVFDRQTMQPDGTWPDTSEMVPPVIGQLSFREDLATFSKQSDSLEGDADKDARLAFRDTLVGEIYKPSRQTEIIQPVFFETEWASADRFLLDPRGQSTGNRTAAAIDLETNCLRLQNKVDKTRSELDALGGPLEADDSRRTERSNDEGDGGGRGGRGGGAAPPAGGGGTLGGGSKTAGGDDERSNADDAKTERAKKRRISKTLQLRNLERQLEALFDRLREEVPQSDLLGGGGTTMVASLVNLEKDETVLTWTHDLDVQPGETYRYRCVANFYNPFFTRAFQLNSDQRPLAGIPTLETHVSEWSAPVTVDFGTRFFVKSARPPVGKELGQATIEVFSKDGGRYWSETYTVKTGDLIGGTKRRSKADPIDFNTNWYVVDVISISSNDESGTPGAEVVVHRLGSSDELTYRNPFDDAVDPELERLDSLVDNADLRSMSVLKREGDTNKERGGGGGGRSGGDGGGGRD